MQRLEIKTGKASGKVVELMGTTITLGNRRNATVELKDAWVSFNHAQITRQGDRYFIADAHSRAGTYVNDRRVDRTPVPIGPGDRILLGKTEIVVTGEAVATAAPVAAPVAAPAVPFAPPVDHLRIESLERDLRQATGDLKNLREHVVSREKELALTGEKLRALQAAPRSDGDEVARWKKACEDLKEKARAKLEEVARYVKQLEARLQSSGGGDTHALVEPGGAGGAEPPHATYLREIARLRDEVTRVQEDAQKRLLDAAEKMQKESGDAAALEQERKRADDLEREAGILRSRVQDLEGEKKKLEADLKAVRSEITGYEQALEERNKDVERLESIAVGAGSSATPAADSAELDRLKSELDAEKKRSEDFQRVIVDLRTQVEEINQDMLSQEDELREEIAALEKKLAEAVQPKPS